MTVYIHHGKLHFVVFTFDVGVGSSVHLKIDSPATLDDFRALKKEGSRLKGRIVSFEKWNKLILTDFVKSVREEKATKSSFRLFPFRPGPEEAPLPRETPPKTVNQSLAPIGTVQIPAGYESALVSRVIARVG